ncbi:MAG: zinc-ribbon domain-containing protein, partial [Candidatus Bathycorpusculaceae bacterium]
MIKCTRCGREIPEDSKFCPYCGLRLFEVDKTAYLTTSAILMFVSASMLLSGAIYGFWSSFRTAFAPFRYLGFASGLVAGILATGKRNFIATIILNLMLIAFSIITINEWLPEITPLALSILSLIFLSLSKSEFERWGERKPTL